MLGDGHLGAEVVQPQRGAAAILEYPGLRRQAPGYPGERVVWPPRRSERHRGRSALPQPLRMPREFLRAPRDKAQRRDVLAAVTVYARYRPGPGKRDAF
jgi:hypothetical protein